MVRYAMMTGMMMCMCSMCMFCYANKCPSCLVAG